MTGSFPRGVIGWRKKTESNSKTLPEICMKRIFEWVYQVKICFVFVGRCCCFSWVPHGEQTWPGRVLCQVPPIMHCCCSVNRRLKKSNSSFSSWLGFPFSLLWSCTNLSFSATYTLWFHSEFSPFYPVLCSLSRCLLPIVLLESSFTDKKGPVP